MRLPTFVFIATIVVLFWLAQFVGHQIWRYYSVVHLSKIAIGLPAVIVVLMLAFLPAIFMAVYSRPAIIPRTHASPWHGSTSWILLVLVVVFATLNWVVFARDAAFFPLHVYGDEFFHNQRTTMVRDYISDLAAYFSGARPDIPFHAAHFIFYPSSAYLANAAFAAAFGDVAAIVNERLALVPHFLAVAVVTFAGALALSGNRYLALLLALIPASAPLLLSYTMSYYIELQYVAVYLLSALLLHRGIEHGTERTIWAAILIASVGPIIRESTVPIAISIAATGAFYFVWHGRFGPAITLGNVLRAAYVFVAALTPFLLFYAAKTAYTDWDQMRMSNANILKQEYGVLLGYSLLYLGPAWPILAVSALFSKRLSDRMVAVAMWASIGGALLLYARFAPGYMPWSRNYLMFYAPIMMLMVIGALHLNGIRKLKIPLVILLGGSVVFNLGISSLYLNNNLLFHESEAVLNDRLIVEYVKQHPSNFLGQTIYGQHPVFCLTPAVSLADFAEYREIPSLAKQSQFFTFSKIASALPSDGRYLIYYYFKNQSRPPVFSALPAAERPSVAEGFRILAESSDPWSAGRTGMLLLERLSSTSNNRHP